MLRLSARQLDLAKCRRWRHAGKQVAQLFKRIGLQAGEIRIHSLVMDERKRSHYTRGFSRGMVAKFRYIRVCV